MKKTINFLKGLGLMLLTILTLSSDCFAQSCDPKSSGAPCVGNPINFTANAPGSTTWIWKFGDGNSSNQRDPSHNYLTAGAYQVELTSSGAVGTCKKTITVVVKPSPIVKVKLIDPKEQCFENNKFCFTDSSIASDPSSKITFIEYLFSDGKLYQENNPTFPKQFCHTIIDPTGGWFDLTIRATDQNGCITRVVISGAINVWPKLGIEIVGDGKVGCDSTEATITNKSLLKIKDVAKFVYNFGDGTSIQGDSITNTSWYTTPSFKHKYYKNGVFDASLTVTSRFGCTETFTYKAVATNIKMRPRIIADMDSSCVSSPNVVFKIVDEDPTVVYPNGMPDGTSAFLWNFGDPPSGPANFNDQEAQPTKSYGVGQWLTTLRIVAGPCDIKVSDTIFKLGPISTIEVPFVRIAQNQAFQCEINKCVTMVNNSSFYHNDPMNITEDSVTYVNGKREYVFNYSYNPSTKVSTGDQTAIVSGNQRADRHKDHVLRLWTFGDNYAPKCTTDTKRNRNVGINCNFSLDSLPTHCYSKWDSVYLYTGVYTQPARRVLIHRGTQTCYQVQVYAADTMFVPEQTFIRQSVVSKYPSINTVQYGDRKYTVPAGVKVFVKDLQNGTTRFITGPGVFVIKLNEQFELTKSGDSISAVKDTVVIKANTIFAQTSNYIKDTIIMVGGSPIATTVIRSKKFIDPGFHRDRFYKNQVSCFNVTLWHIDTIHSLRCESTGTKNLALMPPNSSGLKFKNKPCPYNFPGLDPADYQLLFELEDTKPGCTQNWFAVNYDSLAGKNNWVPSNSGGVLAPPVTAPSPIPYVMPYAIVGNPPNQFVKGYSSAEIGTKYYRPGGWFTVGLIVGNWGPNTQGNQQCYDTTWYHNFFNIPQLNATFTIHDKNYNVISNACLGDTVYFQLSQPLMDSVTTMGWGWGNYWTNEIYTERTYRYQPYPGPSPTRNDRNIVYNKSTDKWLYNYTIREVFDGFKTITLDTIVTYFHRDWIVKVSYTESEKQVKQLFKAYNIPLDEIKPEDVPYYLGNGKGLGGCVDTTGVGKYFLWGKTGIRDSLVVKRNPYVYRYTNSTKKDSVIIEQVLHFRDTSMQGFDTIRYKSNGKDTVRAGMYKYVYNKYQINKNACNPANPKLWDTAWSGANGRFVPSFQVFNSNGCRSMLRRELLIGFFHDWKLVEDVVCNGNPVALIDSVRYFGYQTRAWLDPMAYWNDGNRFLNDKEQMKVDWDLSDPSVKPAAGTGPFTYIYKQPGEYKIRIEMRDSNGCWDKVDKVVWVTGVKAGFEANQALLACKNFVTFFDTSIVFDPCYKRDTCPGKKTTCDSIVRYEWSFGDGKRNSVLKSPTHDYTSSGYFTIKMKVWTLLGCMDSTERTIFIAGPQPEFDLANTLDDSITICIGDSIGVDNMSKDPKTNPRWIWEWGDSTTTTQTKMGTAYHIYKKTGRYEIFLQMFDSIPGTSIYCDKTWPDKDTTILPEFRRRIVVIVKPIPPVDFTISDSIVCRYDVITFNSTSDSIYTKFKWSFGDGDTAMSKLVNHSYKTNGNKIVTLEPDYDVVGFEKKCITSVSKSVRIVDVKADFDIDTLNQPIFCFKNKSGGASDYRWDFRSSFSFNEMGRDYEPCYNYGEELGVFKVCLIAISSEGCEDTICKVLNNRFIAKIIPFNVFTPGQDNFNNIFKFDVEGEEKFDLKIYNRWGELVFESTDKNYNWNGRYKNDGIECPEGAYFYILNFKLRGRLENEGKGPVSGTVTLIRKRQ